MVDYANPIVVIWRLFVKSVIKELKYGKPKVIYWLTKVES